MATDTSDRHWNWRLLSLGLGLLGCCWALPAWAEEADTLASSRRTFHFVQQSQEQDANQDGDNAPVLPPTIVEEDEPEEEPAPEPPVPPAPTPPPPAPVSPFEGTFYDSPFSGSPTAGEGYGIENNTTGTKLNIPALDFPGVVNIVPQDLIEDQLNFRIDDALRNVPSVAPTDNAGGRTDVFFIRGFASGFQDFRKDGFRDTSRVERDVANLDRIEVLKGPAAILYGSAGQPGGVVNFVTKKPLDTTFAQANGFFGDFDFARTSLDVNTPLMEDGAVLGRMNVAYESGNSFRDLNGVDRIFIAPAISARLTEDTTITVLGEYLHDSRKLDRGIVALNGDPFAVPINNFLGEPEDQVQFDDGQINVILDHRLNDDWALRAGWVSNFSREFGRTTENSSLVGGTTLLNRTITPDRALENEDHFFIADLTGSFRTGILDHQLLVGTELGQQIFKNDIGEFATNPIDVLNPVYGSDPLLFPTLDVRQETNLYQQGYYVQDLIEIGPKLKALAGVRYDIFLRNETSQISALIPPGLGIPPGFQPIPVPDESTYADNFAPRFGLVYQPIPDVVSFYGSYSESFFLAGGAVATGANPFNPFDPANFGSLEPETSQATDFGVKLQATENLSILVGGFYIERQNITITDPNNPGGLFFIQLGESRSQGVEVEVVGDITDQWQIIAGYGYADAIVTGDANPANVGLRIPEVPRNTGNLFTRYNFVQNEDLVLGISTGVFYIGDRIIGLGSSPNSIRVPSYTRWDGGVYAEYQNLSATLFIENIGDINYIAGGFNQFNLFPGNPTTVRGAVSLSY